MKNKRICLFFKRIFNFFTY